MNLKSEIKKSIFIVATIVMATIPSAQTFANNDSDDFGIWTSIDASKKLTDKLKFGIEGEFRTTDGVKEVDRRALGVSMSYKMFTWLKADIGYIYMNSFEPEEITIKDQIDENKYNYNRDHAYRVNKDRLFVALTGSFDIGRLEFSIRERLQYTYTNDAFTTEDKGRWEYKNGDLDTPVFNETTEVEQKDAKRNTTLRSRLTVKWDIRKCHVKPFVSAELFTRTDEWRFHDKIRYRAGASYKIDKDNEVSLFYIYQDANDNDEPAGHAIGASYSFDL